VSQFVIDEDPMRIGRLVLTNCDAFDTFPPFPFNLLFRLGRHPGAARLVLQTMRPASLRNGLLGFGPLVRRRLTAEDTAGWIRPYLTDPGVRHDTTSFLRGWRPEDLADVATRLHKFERPVLIAWAPSDRFFKIALGRRLASVFRDVRLVEVPNAATLSPDSVLTEGCRPARGKRGSARSIGCASRPALVRRDEQRGPRRVPATLLRARRVR
jgi:pimeloyl-ACP methyl ester carboxylesterase